MKNVYFAWFSQLNLIPYWVVYCLFAPAHRWYKSGGRGHVIFCPLSKKCAVVSPPQVAPLFACAQSVTLPELIDNRCQPAWVWSVSMAAWASYSNLYSNNRIDLADIYNTSLCEPLCRCGVFSEASASSFLRNSVDYVRLFIAWNVYCRTEKSTDLSNVSHSSSETFADVLFFYNFS